MKHVMIASMMAIGLTGCSAISNGLGPGASTGADRKMKSAVGVPGATQTQDTVLPSETLSPPPAPTARTAEALDTTTPAQRAAAIQPPAGGARVLGTTVASLGSATEPGLWMKTPLVNTEIQGRVTNPATGKSSTVTLIPIKGAETAGSRMSLSALRLIGASLTDLTSVIVSTGG